MIYIGIDDTDTESSRGTGWVARQVAAKLADAFEVLGVVRQQLLKDPRVPCTRNNSCKCVILAGGENADLALLAERVAAVIMADFQEGSDPGLCVSRDVPPSVVAFGQRAQEELLTQDEARALAARHDIILRGLGGDEMGVIGALAAVGLTAAGNAGRYIQVGRLRELRGLQPVEALLSAGIAAVRTAEGEDVTSGLVLADKLRPARRNGAAVAVVTRQGDHWQPLKLN